MKVVYRTTHPAVTEAIADYKKVMEVWRAEADQLAADIGFPGRHFAVLFALGSRWVVGFEHTDGDTVPAGWRVAERAGMQVIVPDKRRKKGKEIAARLEACKPPDDLRTTLPGMPDHHWIDHRILTPGLEEMAGVVWVLWSSEVPGVDTATWERTKLSQYYLAVEAKEGGEPT